MNPNQKQVLLSIAVQAAKAAGTIIKQAKAKGIKYKGNVDLVTETDLASEAEICTILSAHTRNTNFGRGVWRFSRKDKMDH